MVVAPVEQRDLDPVDVAEEPARGQPTEAAAHDHDAMASFARSVSRCDEAVGGVDQREVGERLRVVAEVLPGRDVDLLRVEQQRSGERQQLLEQRTRPFDLADDRERGNQPEGADRERPLLAGEPVVGGVDLVAEHEAVLGQFVGDRQDRRADTFVVGGQEAHDGDQQQRHVERVGAVVLA